MIAAIIISCGSYHDYILVTRTKDCSDDHSEEDDSGGDGFNDLIQEDVVPSNATSPTSTSAAAPTR